MQSSKQTLNDKEKEELIDSLTPHLAILRTQADVSQDELSNLIGVSRQTYSAVERNKRKMSWNTYLSLVFFYDRNQKTHNLMRNLSLFPKQLLIYFNDGKDIVTADFETLLGDKAQEIVEQLDDDALQNVRKLIMDEYARCTESSDDAVVKAFEGTPIAAQTATERDVQILKAIKAIIAGSENNEE